MRFNNITTTASFVTTLQVTKKNTEHLQWVFILVAVAGGIIFGVVVLLLICRARSRARSKRDKKPEKTVPRVPFKIPSPKMDSHVIPTQTRYPQQEHYEIDQYLDPKIYRDNDEGGSPFMGSARLCFSLRYDKFNEELMVCLIRATRLTPIGENVTVTPYVKIFLLPDKKYKVQSKVLRRTSNPQFFEDFVFMVSSEDLPNRTLEFTVCEFDRFSRQQVIGHVMYPLKGVNVVALPQGTGEIWVDIKNEDLKKGVDKGELLFSLQFLPTSCRLTVAVLKAKDLKLHGEGTDMDPYVKVSMIMGGKTLKKRKTVTNKKNACPVYNEAFVFTILPSCLDRVSFMLSVYTVPRLGGSKKLIGRAVVGPYMYSTGQGLSHWNDMISSPRNPVAQWHTLI
ncbi:synaptotagmin-6-like isoform X2 [Oculina patagonica]